MFSNQKVKWNQINIEHHVVYLTLKRYNEFIMNVQRVMQSSLFCAVHDCTTYILISRMPHESGAHDLCL